MNAVRSWIALFVVSMGCGGPPSETRDSGPVDVDPFGETHTGQYHLGPVDWEGSEYWNACAPYPSEIQAIEGEVIAGLSNEIAASGSHCDACIFVTTDAGRSILARVVTYGVSNAAGDIDVSPAMFDALHQGEFPRAMRWQLARCGSSEPIYVQFQTGAHEYWTSFWIRNPNVAVQNVEVRSANHADYFGMRRAPDGTWNDDGGFGLGPFTLRITGVDGSSIEEAFDGFSGGDLLRASANLPR
jgi:hypothetical protein